MINVLVSNFFSRKEDEEFFEFVKTWAILGINWMQAFKYTHLQKKGKTRIEMLELLSSSIKQYDATSYVSGQIAMVCFLIYIVLFLMAGAYLAFGSISVSVSKCHKFLINCLLNESLH